MAVNRVLILLAGTMLLGTSSWAFGQELAADARQPVRRAERRTNATRKAPTRPARFLEPIPAPDELSDSDSRPGSNASDDSSSQEGPVDGHFEPLDGPYDLDAPAPEISSGEWLRNGCWYTHQSAVYMSRSVSVKNSITIGVDFSSAVDPHLRNFLNIPLDMGYQPGLRSTFGRYLGRDTVNRDHSIEFTFLGLTQWHAAGQMTAVSAGGIFTPLDPAGSILAFNRAFAQSFNQTSNFNSYEINYRLDRRLPRDQLTYTRDSAWVRTAKPSLLPSIMAGIRVVGINENLNFFSQSSTLPASNGSYRIFTHNIMVGPQMGGDWFYDRGYWRLGVRGKSGALVNFATQSSQVRFLDTGGNPLSPNRDEHAELDILAFVGELNFMGNYQFNPNFGLRASYDMIFATNLALVQNQLTFTPSMPAGISSEHSLFFQGVSLGFEFTH